MTAGEVLVSAVAVVALALGFLGLLHALMEGVVGEESRHRRRHPRSREERPTRALTAVLGIALLGCTAVGLLLPGSGFIETLTKGTL